MSTCKFSPYLLADAQELEVKDGSWTGIFFRSSQYSEGRPIFSKMKGSRETWQLKMIKGAWTFLDLKSGRLKEHWEPRIKAWVAPNGMQKQISVRVRKTANRKKSNQKNWGDKLVRALWEKKIGYDLKIRLQDGQEIYAHKGIIAASCPAWKGLLESSMVEADDGVIVVPDIDPNVVKGFVKGLYLGEFGDIKLLPGIALLADRYNAEHLMDKVIEAMPQALKTEGASFYFQVVEVLKRLPDNRNRRELKKILYSLNNETTEAIFFESLGSSYPR